MDTLIQGNTFALTLTSTLCWFLASLQLQRVNGITGFQVVRKHIYITLQPSFGNEVERWTHEWETVKHMTRLRVLEFDAYHHRREGA
jgi:hypothetical protein